MKYLKPQKKQTNKLSAPPPPPPPETHCCHLLLGCQRGSGNKKFFLCQSEKDKGTCTRNLSVRKSDGLSFLFRVHEFQDNVYFCVVCHRSCGRSLWTKDLEERRVAVTRALCRIRSHEFAFTLEACAWRVSHSAGMDVANCKVRNIRLRSLWSFAGAQSLAAASGMEARVWPNLMQAGMQLTMLGLGLTNNQGASSSLCNSPVFSGVSILQNCFFTPVSFLLVPLQCLLFCPLNLWLCAVRVLGSKII